MTAPKDNICISCTNVGCEFQSGIVRKECAFYKPPHIEPDNCGNLYWGEILDKFIENYNHAFCNEHIRKPKSWALYKTWKLVDSIEKSRFGENENERNN